MNNIEETLWNYIDGTCTVAEQRAISSLIASDEAYRLKYEALLSFNQEITAMELDEPPMAFTYNVLESIRTENAQTPLKAAINKRIILSIAAFFILSITVLLVYVFASVNWSFGSFTFNVSAFDFKMPSALKLPEVKSYLTGPVMQGFLFFDVVLGLFFADFYLRKRKFSKDL